MKVCTTCKISKYFNCFHKSKSNSDGLYGICKECRKPKSLDYRQKNGDRIRANWRAAYAADPTKHRANASRWSKANPDRCRAAGRRWTKNNRSKANEHTAKRYAALRQATPPWITKGHRSEMQWFYETAQELQWLSDEPLCVDHIEPLRGEISSGLHVPWNLQIISVSANSRKGNRLGDAIG